LSEFSYRDFLVKVIDPGTDTCKTAAHGGAA